MSKHSAPWGRDTCHLGRYINSRIFYFTLLLEKLSAFVHDSATSTTFAGSVAEHLQAGTEDASLLVRPATLSRFETLPLLINLPTYLLTYFICRITIALKVDLDFLSLGSVLSVLLFTIFSIALKLFDVINRTSCHFASVNCHGILDDWQMMIHQLFYWIYCYDGRTDGQNYSNTDRALQ